MAKKVKLLMVVNSIPHYRLPIYNLLGLQFDLTVSHYSNKLLDESLVTFKQILLTPKYFAGFISYKEDLSNFVHNYDVVISLADIRAVPNMLLSFKKRNFKLIYWGIGVGASYNKHFDGDSYLLNKLRLNLVCRGDALVFYSDYPIKKYVDFGVSKDKLFVAHNTVQVQDRIPISTDKKYFIFVGTLYKQKRIYELLEAYLKHVNSSSKVLPLLIVGDGDEMEPIKAWITDNDLKNNIILKGSIFNQEELKFLYQDAIACISPGQAGLTVLNCMAYGVPFVTSKDAITGGEILNIKDNETGIIYDGSIIELSRCMNKITEDTVFSTKLAVNAQHFYFENRTIDKMFEGFVSAINFVLKNQ